MKRLILILFLALSLSIIWGTEYVLHELSDSPAQSAFTENTYVGSGWTDFVVTGFYSLTDVVVDFTWVTDGNNEGSFWLESPLGTTVQMAFADLNGTYQLTLTDFAGEDPNGIWILWIEDSAADGGEQATGVSVGFYGEIGVPTAAINPLPVDVAVLIALDGSLTWDFGLSTATYDLWFGPAGSMSEVVTGTTAGATGSYAYTGLDPLTAYEWQVISINGALSIDGPVWSFGTLSTTMPLPIAADFEAGFDYFINDPGNVLDWALNTTYYQGTQSAYIPDTADKYTSILTLAGKIDLSAYDDCALTFTHIAKTAGNNKTNCTVEISTNSGVDWVPLPALTYAGASSAYLTDLYFDEDSYTAWGDDVPENSWFRTEVFDLITYNTFTDVMIRFKLWDNSNSVNYGWIVDDISIAGMPLSPGSPTVVNPVDTATDVSAYPSLAWFNGIHTDYVEILLDTVNPPIASVYDGIAVEALSNATINAPLSLSTTYYWQVIAENAFDTTNGAIWSFTTMGDPTIVTFPYTENFDSVTLPLLPPGWESYISGFVSCFIEVKYATTPASAPNNLVLRSYTATDVLIASTPVVTDITGKNVNFNCRSGAASGVSVIVGSMSDPSDAETFTQIGDPIALTNAWAEYIVGLADATGDRLAFKHIGYANPAEIFIDDVIIEAEPVLETPVVTIVEAGGDVILSWDVVLATSFYIYSCDSPDGVYTRLGQVDGSSFSYTDTGVTEDKKFYQVISSDDAYVPPVRDSVRRTRR